MAVNLIDTAGEKKYSHTMSEIHVGQYPKLSRRDFLKVGGAAATGALLASCGPKPDLTHIQVQATKQALEPEGKRIADLLPQWILSGLTRIEITPLELASVSTRPVGTGQVYIETPTHLVVTTAEHVGRGIFWKNLDVSFPFGYENRSIHIDAGIGAPNGPAPTDDDWWIQAVTKHSDVERGVYHPIRAIVIRKPVGFKGYVTRPEYGVLKPYTAEIKRGDIFYCGGFPVDTQGKLVFAEMSYQRDTKLPDHGDIKFHEFEGPLGEGMSGAVIMTQKGECVAVVSGSVQEKNIATVYGIPFAKYNPLQDVLSILQKV